MKQLLQDLRTGDIVMADLATPNIGANELLIRSRASVISTGTERMLRDFAKGGYFAKACQQPEKVKQVLEKVRSDGLVATYGSVQAKLSQPMTLGYSNVGTVEAVGSAVAEFSVGDRVASNGCHAELVTVPHRLCARVPDGVGDDEAAVTVVGAIALQAVRLIRPEIGESVCVFGLGLIGQLAVQLLRAAGCRVLGLDYKADRVGLASSFGAEAHDLSTTPDPEALAAAFSRGRGVDAILIAASTDSDDVIHQAAAMSRKRGRIVLVGTTGLKLRRSDFYEKELSFQVSCSYGPGRYDHGYEVQGHDYPYAYVRWTEQRNFEAFLELLRTRAVSTAALVTMRMPFAKAEQAYEALEQQGPIGILLEYDSTNVDLTVRAVKTGAPVRAAAAAGRDMTVAVIGAGQFSQLRLLPALRRLGVRMKWVVSEKGVSGAVSAQRFAIERHTTDARFVFDDPETDAVVVATRHASHASLAADALLAGKHVFVEKPLCVSAAELQDLTTLYDGLEAKGRVPVLMVDFNRRFAPLVNVIHRELEGRNGTIAASFLCNAGALPADHWLQSEGEGGRILGEVCHFIDLIVHLAGSSVVSVSATALKDSQSGATPDSAAIILTLLDGSVAQIGYFANGHRRFEKERLKIFCDGKTIDLNNFRRLQGYGTTTFRRRRSFAQDKGHANALAAFVDAVRTGADEPIPFSEIANVTQSTIAAVKAIASGEPVSVPVYSAKTWR